MTSQIMLTAWAGFYLGSMRSGLTSMHWGLIESLFGIALVSCGASALNQVIERPDTAAIRGMVAKVPHLVEIVK